MKFLIRYGLLPILFLMSFALSSDAFRFRFGIDLSFVTVAVIVLYYLFGYKKRLRGGLMYSWWLYLLVVPSIAMTILEGGRLEHTIYSTFILMLPFALEPYVPGNDKQTIKGMYLTFIVSVVLLLMYSNLGFLSSWNPNNIAYLLYLGVASSVVVLADNRKNVVVWVLLAYVFVQLLVTQSRNVMTSLIIIVVAVLLKKSISRRMAYRIVYGFFLLYPAIFPKLSIVAGGTEFYKIIKEITMDVFDKSSVLSGRDIIFREAERLLNTSLFNYVLGFGNSVTNVLAVHNGYYALRYAYGIMGTLVIAGLFVYFFEKAYVLVKKGDSITYGCVVIIWGILFQQASEGWFIGTPLVALMSFVYMAIVIKRFRIKEGNRLKDTF